MAPYAKGTKVPIWQSQKEVERILARYGADAFGYVTEPGTAAIMFRAHGRFLKFRMPLPADDAQEERRRWRALVLVLKAKLEAVNSGIVSFEEEFLPWVVLPDGSTMGEWAAPRLEQAYIEGKMPLSLLEDHRK